MLSDEVGEEEKEQYQRDDQEVHVEAEKDASVVKAPAALHAAGGVRGTYEYNESGKQEPERGAQVGRMREQDGNAQASEDKDVGPDQRCRARIEDAYLQANSLVRRCGWWWNWLRGGCRRCGCGLGHWRQPADGRNRNFDSTEVVGGNVMQDDAQVRFAFDRRRDFQVVGDG